MSIKYCLNIIRHNYYVSLAARWVLRPIHCICSHVASQIEKKVWVNGATVVYDGISLTFPRDVGVDLTTAVSWRGAYERNTWRTLKVLLLDAGCFIDVGSNIGLFAVMAKKFNPDVQVEAFEPISSIYEKNLAFHQTNKITDNQTHNLALADFEGEAELLLPQEPGFVGEGSAGTLRQDSWQSRKPLTLKLQARAATLDSFLSKREVRGPLVLKVDVEDFEASVLRGALGTMARWRPRIVCEILPRQHGNKATLAVLRSCSYAMFALTDGGLFRVQEPDFVMNRAFMDFLLIHSEEVPVSRNFIPYDELADLLSA